VKFRRKAAAADDLDLERPDSHHTDDSHLDEAASPSGAEPTAGPYDAEDLPDTEGRIDLGALLLLPVPGTDLQLQVDEASGTVQSVMFAAPEGALELKVFAAPRNGDLWSEVRPQLAADMARRGGTATEQEGSFGPELACRLTVQGSDGRTGEQPSRIVGINGSRWMLRATFLGKPALDAETATRWEETLRTIAVRRGDHAMPVGDPLPVVLPDQARRVTPPGGTGPS
jgi:hypothetical protein